MAMMAAMPIYGKNTLRILFPGIIRQISMKLGYEALATQAHYILTLTYLMTRWNFATEAFV